MAPLLRPVVSKVVLAGQSIVITSLYIYVHTHTKAKLSLCFADCTFLFKRKRITYKNKINDLNVTQSINDIKIFN